jgi:hypothetical protein
MIRIDSGHGASWSLLQRVAFAGRRYDMAPDNAQDAPAPDALAPDEMLVYFGGTSVGDDKRYEEQAGLGRKRIKERGLEVVKIDDEELDRLRGQVRRIATRLESSDETQQAGGFGVESITLHVGLSASGHFFLVASAEIEAAIDITWRTRK